MAKSQTAKTLIITGAAGLIGLAAFVYFKYDRNAVGSSNPEISSAVQSQKQILNSSEDQPPAQPSTAIHSLNEKLKGDYPEATLQKISILREILGSRNDNDPRLDQAFNNLSKDDKTALREQYHSLPREARNELGTIIFLMAQGKTDDADHAFFKEVLTEPPCLGLADCSKETEATHAEEAHHEVGLDTDLNYPQIVVLQKKIDAITSATDDTEKEKLKKEAYELVLIAKRTGIPKVMQKAAELEALL